MFINGQKVLEKNIILRVGLSGVTLGAMHDGNTPFEGLLSSLSFYDAPLTEEEIARLYDNNP